MKSQSDAASSSSSRPGQTNTSSAGQLSIINYQNASFEVKVIWLAKLASCNFTFRSADGINDTFKAMFPDSKVASSFSLSRSRASYVIGEGMGPHFTEVMSAFCA